MRVRERVCERGRYIYLQRERERERERQADRQRQTETEKECVGIKQTYNNLGKVLPWVSGNEYVREREKERKRERETVCEYCGCVWWVCLVCVVVCVCFVCVVRGVGAVVRVQGCL